MNKAIIFLTICAPGFVYAQKTSFTPDEVFLKISASFTNQLVAHKTLSQQSVYVGVYEVGPELPAVLATDESGIVDPYFRWLISSGSDANYGNGHFPLRLTQQIYGKCPSYVWAKSAANSPGIGVRPEFRLYFNGAKIKKYLLIFSGGTKAEGFVIKPLNDWDSIVGVVSASELEAIKNPALKTVIDPKLIPLLKEALEKELPKLTK